MTPEFEQRVFIFLDNLRDSGATNMYGAVPYIVRAFKIDSKEAGSLLTKWMETFSERRPS